VPKEQNNKYKKSAFTREKETKNFIQKE